MPSRRYPKTAEPEISRDAEGLPPVPVSPGGGFFQWHRISWERVRALSGMNVQIAHDSGNGPWELVWHAE